MYDIKFLENVVSNTLGEKRARHSFAVAKLAKEIASYYDVDINKAYVAGLLHDITKEISDDKQNEILRNHKDFIKLDSPIKVKHAYSAKYYVNDELHIEDDDILDAIYNHTILESNRTLSKIIYIADKREENRHIDDDVIDIAKVDIDKAVNVLKIDVDEYLKSIGEK